MKINEETKILALTECCILWDRLAETGSSSKGWIINDLWVEGKLWKHVYNYKCPFCEYLRNEDDEADIAGCQECLWPGDKNQRIRCQHGSTNLFRKWMNASEEEETKRAARNILNMLLKIEI